MRFFKKIQDWIFKSERIRKLILRFFTRQINPRSPGSWCLKGTEESTLEVDSPVPLTRHDPRDLGLICLVKKRKIRFQILADFKIQSWIFLKKRTLRLCWIEFGNRTKSNTIEWIAFDCLSGKPIKSKPKAIPSKQVFLVLFYYLFNNRNPINKVSTKVKTR